MNAARAAFLIVSLLALLAPGVPSRVLAADEGIPTFSHVFVMVLENQSYDDLVGNPDAAFINGVLEKHHASATQFYAPFHNSPSDYFALSSGRGYAKGDGGDWGGTCLPSATCSTDDVSVFQQLNEQGKTWKIYSEDQTVPCQTRSARKYWVGHNPAPFYSNLGPNDYIGTGNGTCRTSDVGYEALAQDLAGGTVPELAFLIPNNCNNMHDSCLPLSHPVKQGDLWLREQLTGDAVVPGGLIDWVKANDTLLVITFDEGGFSDHATCCPFSEEGGGGHIPTWIIGPDGKVRSESYRSEVQYSLYSILRTVEENFDLELLGHAAEKTTTDLADFFPSRIGFGYGAGVAGGRATVTGEKFEPGERVDLRWDCLRPGCHGSQLADPTADANGSFVIHVTIPIGADLGVHAVGGTGAESGLFGSSSFTVRPGVATHPELAAHGTEVVAEGAGFAPNEAIDLTLTCDDGTCDTEPLGRAIADDRGMFDGVNVTIPANAPNGRHVVRGTGASSGIVRTFTFHVVAGVTLSPERGTAGSQVLVTGRGFPPDSKVDVVWDCRNLSCSGAVLATADADEHGDFEARTTAPGDVGEGNYAIAARGPARSFARAWFKVKEPLAVAPATGSPGRKVSVSGAGYDSDERVEIRWQCAARDCPGPVIGLGEANEDGEIGGVEVTIPESVPAGRYLVGGVGLRSGTFAQATYTVTPRVDLSPAQGAAGWNLTLSAAGLPADARLTLRWDCAGSACANAPDATATTDAHGEVRNVKVRAPTSGGGNRVLTIAAPDGQLAEVSYRVVAAATLIPATAARLSSVTVRASGFQPGERVSVLWDCESSTCSPSSSVGSEAATTDGSLEIRFRIPRDAAYGDHAISVVGAESKSVATTTLTVGDVVAATGSGGLSIVAIGVGVALLTLVGIATFVLGVPADRRRT